MGVRSGVFGKSSIPDTPAEDTLGMALTDTAIKNAKPATKATKMFDGGGLCPHLAAGRIAPPGSAALR